MDEVLAASLHGGITDYPDCLERMVALGDDATRTALLNGELPKLTATVRDLIEQHRPDSKGRCPAVPGGDAVAPRAARSGPVAHAARDEEHPRG